MNSEVCKEHSGYGARISNLEGETKGQWEANSDMRRKTDAIMSKLNVILGGIVIALIGIVLNLIIRMI